LLTQFYQEHKTLIVVPTVSLVHQLAGDFKGYGYNKQCKLITAGIDKNNIEEDIVVTTWQSVYNMPKEWFSQFGVVIGDEAHLFKAKSLTQIMTKLTDCKYRFGFTGTLDGAEAHKLVLEGLFGPTKSFVSTKDLIDSGTVADLKIKILVLKYSDEISKMVCKLDFQDEMDFLVRHQKRNNFINNLCLWIVFYSFISIFGLFINNNQFFLDRIWWNIAYLNVLIFLYLSRYLFDYSFFRNILLILLFFIFCFYFPLVILTVTKHFTSQSGSLYFSTVLSPSTYIFEQGMPRTSGVARALYFLFLLTLSFLCFKKNYFYINLFISSILTWFIFILESRITSIFFFISLLIVFYSTLDLSRKFLVLFILITISTNGLSIYKYVSQIYSNNIKVENFKPRVKSFFKNLDMDKMFTYDNHEPVLFQEVSKYEIIFFNKKFHCNTNHLINNITSGRICIWTDNLNAVLKKYSTFFFGYGAQADRYNVKYINTPQEQSASNSFVYALSSGGIFSLFSTLLIYIIFFYNFLYFFLFSKDKFLNVSCIHVASLLINAFILFRGISESSFLIFSLDYILFLVTAFIIFQKNLNVPK
jgi:hypothetical protein